MLKCRRPTTLSSRMPLMQRYSLPRLLAHARRHHEDWQRAWRNPAPKDAYDTIIVRRRRPRTRDRLLPREGTRHHGRRRNRARLPRRRQHRPEHDHRPLQLPARRVHPAVRLRARPVARPQPRDQLQRHVQRPRRAEPRAHPAGHARHRTPRGREPAERPRRRSADGRRSAASRPDHELLAHLALPPSSAPPGSHAAALRATTRWRGGTPAPRTRWASTSCSRPKSSASGSTTGR